MWPSLLTREAGWPIPCPSKAPNTPTVFLSFRTSAVFTCSRHGKKGTTTQNKRIVRGNLPGGCEWCFATIDLDCHKFEGVSLSHTHRCVGHLKTQWHRRPWPPMLTRPAVQVFDSDCLNMHAIVYMAAKRQLCHWLSFSTGRALGSDPTPPGRGAASYCCRHGTAADSSSATTFHRIRAAAATVQPCKLVVYVW